MGKREGFYKKTLGIALGISLMLSPMSGAYANPAKKAPQAPAKSAQSDVKGHWAEKTLQEWKEQGFLNGDAAGKISPNASVTRAELSALINRSFKYETQAEIAYSDVKKTAWYYNDLAIAASHGYMKGHANGTFKPDAQVTRQELAVVLSSILQLKAADGTAGYSDTVNSPVWSKNAIQAVSNNGIMKGSQGKFRPTQGATRAEAVSVLDRALKQMESRKVTTYDKPGTYGPASGKENIPGSVNIKVPDVTLQNMVIEGDLVIGEGVGEGDVTLKGVTVKGSTTIKGGGKNSIHVVDSVLLTVIVNKKDGSIRIVAEGSSSVSQITLQSGAVLEESGLTGEGFKDLLLSEIIPAGANVSLAGQFETVDITAASLSVNLASGSVGELNVAPGAANTNLNVSAGSSIMSLILNAVTAVTGTGTVSHAQVNVPGVSFTQRPGNLTAPGNVSVGGGQSPSTGGQTPAPVTDRLQLLNGQAVLQFVNAVPALELADLSITAKVTDVVYTLEDVAFNSQDNKLTFKPISMDEHYGKILSLQVSPAAGSTKFSSVLSGSVKIEGFEGTIRDVDDQPVSGEKIDFRRGLGNTTGAVVTTATTDVNGKYTAYLPAGIYTGQLDKAGFITTHVVGVSLSDSFNRAEDATAIKIPAGDEIRIVLTWGENPWDEDSHLLGPTPAGYSFHTYFAEREYYYKGEKYADLDHDDVDSFGPETTTIRKRVDGKYQFYVHNFSGNGNGAETLRNSSAKVEIYNGSNASPVKTYHIPAGSGNELYWYVFDMEVKGSELTFTDHNKLVHEEPQSDLPPVWDNNDAVILEEEAAKFLNVTEVTYQTAVGDAVYLTAQPLLQDTELTIQDLQLVSPQSVTDSIYLAVENNAVIFKGYYDGIEPLEYILTVELKRGSYGMAGVVTTILIPTLNDLLFHAASRADELLAERPEWSELAAARDAANSSLTGTTEEKIQALQNLASLIK